MLVLMLELMASMPGADGSADLLSSVIHRRHRKRRRVRAFAVDNSSVVRWWRRPVFQCQRQCQCQCQCQCLEDGRLRLVRRRMPCLGRIWAPSWSGQTDHLTCTQGAIPPHFSSDAASARARARARPPVPRRRLARPCHALVRPHC